LLLLLAAGVALWVRRRKPATVVYPDGNRLRRAAAAGPRLLHPRLLPWLRAAAVLCATVALARPQTGEIITSVEASGIDIMVALDLSSSMWAHDFEVAGVRTDRLTAVKEVLEAFIEERSSDRLGLVAFAALPYLVSPLTLDHDWLQENLERLQIGRIQDGTAIGTAVAMAASRLREREAESRVLILLTDGENNQGSIQPLDAAKAAASFGIRIYAIGVGREGIVPFPRLDPNGVPYRDRLGRMQFQRQRSAPDFSALEEIAAATGGQAFRAENTAALRDIYEAIDRLERTEAELSVRALYADWWLWPLVAALVFFAAEAVLAATRLRVEPATC
jgi:Ca-activated chloride channel family protein